LSTASIHSRSCKNGPVDGLATHLSERYGVTVERLVRLEQDVYRVDGPLWVARCYPPGAHAAAEATAGLLRRLAPSQFPAEPPAHDEAVSDLRGRPVLVTEFVTGPRAPGTPRMFAVLGGLLGALHAHSGETAPPGGAWHHLVIQGTPREEIAAAAALLERADGDPAARRTLRAELDRLDDGADLPHGLVHPDFVPANTIRTEQGPVIVDWAGAGRGPRLWSLGFLLWAAGARDLALVDAVISRYRRHVELTDDELARLPAVIRARPLTLDCWSAAHGRLDWAAAVRALDDREKVADRIAARARHAATA
jgi:Ser/Thr protein kinase RdoA (MazF antagonist)